MKQTTIMGIALIACSVLFFMAFPIMINEGRIPYSIILLLIGLFMLIVGILILTDK